MLMHIDYDLVPKVFHSFDSTSQSAEETEMTIKYSTAHCKRKPAVHTIHSLDPIFVDWQYIWFTAVGRDNISLFPDHWSVTQTRGKQIPIKFLAPFNLQHNKKLLHYFQEQNACGGNESRTRRDVRCCYLHY